MYLDSAISTQCLASHPISLHYIPQMELSERPVILDWEDFRFSHCLHHYQLHHLSSFLRVAVKTLWIWSCLPLDPSRASQTESHVAPNTSCTLMPRGLCTCPPLPGAFSPIPLLANAYSSMKAPMATVPRSLSKGVSLLLFSSTFCRVLSTRGLIALVLFPLLD